MASSKKKSQKSSAPKAKKKVASTAKKSPSKKTKKAASKPATLKAKASPGKVKKKTPAAAKKSTPKAAKKEAKASTPKPKPKAKSQAPAPKKSPSKAPQAKPSKALKTSAPMPQVGDHAPDFQLQTDRGETVAKQTLLGQRVVLYFYPKDDTPGCTREACEFQENIGEIAQHDAVVIGVSPDSAQSHQKFRTKYNLSFPLGIDTDLQVAKSYGVWVEKNMYGRTSMGIQRATFLIDREGRIAAVWPKEKVDGHVTEVLKTLESIP